MNIYKYVKIIVWCFFLFSLNAVFAGNTHSSEFFASNNTKEIDLQTAYNRLTGIEQSHLQNSMINIMQKNHVEQGKFEDKQLFEFISGAVQDLKKNPMCGLKIQKKLKRLKELLLL